VVLKKVIFLLALLGIGLGVLVLTSGNATFSREDSVEVEHSASTVWGALIDAQRWPQWWPGMERVSLDAELREGAMIDLFLAGIPDGEPARVKTVSPLRELAWERSGILGSLTRTRLRLVSAKNGNTVVSLESHILGPQAVLAKYARRDDFAHYHEVVLRSLELHLERGAVALPEGEDL
jgi:hypothetical protein